MINYSSRVSHWSTPVIGLLLTLLLAGLSPRVYTAELSQKSQRPGLAESRPGMQPSQRSGDSQITSGLPQRIGKIAIIIDDLGDNSVIAEQLMVLPKKMTLSLLPQTPQSRKIIKMAKSHGFELMMHLPMEAFSRNDLLGPGALFQHMSREQMAEVFSVDVASLPGVIGFNNHMGSLLSENEQQMVSLMDIAHRFGFYFVDSKTSEQSVAGRVAKERGIRTLSRDIFLDHAAVGITLQGQWQKAIKIAQEQGYAVVICHPYPSTVAFLKKTLTQPLSGVELTTISQLVAEQIQNPKEQPTFKSLSPK